jgi:hypothetical protein
MRKQRNDTRQGRDGGGSHLHRGSAVRRGCRNGSGRARTPAPKRHARALESATNEGDNETKRILPLPLPLQLPLLLGMSFKGTLKQIQPDVAPDEKKKLV